MQYQFDDISLLPIRKELENYSLNIFRKDVFAALTVAMLTIPQAMAYALLAGLPISCGIFASVFSSLIAAFFGSSRHLIVGPSTSIAILLQAAISEVMLTYYRDLVGDEREMMTLMVLSQLVLLTALMQLIAAICKLGRLIQFLSHSVIIGYIAGTTIAIIINQLYPFLGITRLPGISSFYEKGLYLVTHLYQVHVPSALIGIGSLGLIIGLKWWNRKIPSALITFAVMGGIVYFFDLSLYSESGYADPYEDEGVSRVLLLGDVGEQFEFTPSLSYPYFDTGIMNDLLPFAFALALLSVMECTTVAKSVAASSGQRLSVNQQIFGVGIGNFISAWTGGMLISGSSARTSLSYNNGAETRIAAILNCIFSGVIVFAFSFLIFMIPLSSLAALLLITAANIVNPKQFFLCLKSTSSDAFVLWTTFLSNIFFSLDIALYIGVVISIILYLKKAALPQLKEYDIDDMGELVNLGYGVNSEHKPIRVIKVEGELFFGAADLFQTTLKTIAEDDNTTKVIILQLKNARDIDATSCLALHQLHDYLKGTGRYLVACGLTSQIWEVLSDSDLVQLIGKQNLFLFDEAHPHLHMQKAIHRAKQLCNEAAGAVCLKPENNTVLSLSPVPVSVQDQT